ncbi:S-layer homology domain-containing protein [Paenibacillus nasutitermitis]|uniref:SLH domain-containing protein n=1 Tax=Paenibacillus nasutitermitis TaxID=1652958 RepID=A0A917E2Z0_9BACL|nr:S-layer homology domain-containing protein [Paenibacillus nasutitermitis]GGD96382.1 hypothetical protein GCM10010911_63880 [Paenibacillus nasutitermitis]
MRKRTLLSFMVLGLCLSATSVQAAENSGRPSAADFSDLKGLDEATKSKFDAMISAGIFDGVSNDTFGLADNMNRAQFAKVAALVFNLRIDQSLTKSTFKDVKSDDPAHGYALPYIEALKAAGITDGTGNGAFNPAGDVTKEQLAKILILGLGEQRGTSTPPVSDNTVSSWASDYVQRALELKLLENSPDGTFGGKEEASRGLLAMGGFETARTVEKTKPLEVSGADFAAGNKLNLTLTVGVDSDSVDLSKITINGVPLDPKMDSYVLSEDKKTIMIKLHDGFQLDTSKTPVIAVNGLKTLFGNEVKNEESNEISVTLTEPPVKPTTPYIQEPASTQETTNPNPGTDPNQEATNPNPGTDPNQEATNPNPGTDPNQEETNPNPGTDPNQETTNPNQGTDPNQEETNPNPGTDPNQEATNPNQGTDPNQEAVNPNQGTDPNQGATNPNQGTDPNQGATNPNQG